jgi:hypothetical protein
MSGEDLSSREPYFLTAQKCRTRYQCVYEARVLGNGLAARSVMIAGASAGAKALRGCAARPAPAACVARFRTVHVASFEEVRIDLRPVSRFSLYFSSHSSYLEQCDSNDITFITQDCRDLVKVHLVDLGNRALPSRATPPDLKRSTKASTDD